MLKTRKDRHAQEALIKCSNDDSTPSISVIRDSWTDMTCGWLAVRPLPLYELRSSKKSFEWRQKNREITIKDQRRGGIDSTRRLVTVGISKQRDWRGDRPSKKMNIVNGTILGPLTKVTPAQRQLQHDNFARIASGDSTLNVNVRRNEEFRSLKERREREWLPVTSQTSNFALDESRLIVHRRGDVDATTTEGDNSIGMGSNLGHVGLLVRRLMPSGQIIRNLL
ncbi:uncharacterized protein LOC134179195 [Corticium candelabrum]|uniref:uncharacterized protein LOC134179195 n=1 Tax=Corticium candelabrum TaxID=121492 RepID=UPI002E25FA61|nr:uncharacterized protein LOC134179195 [Corticium candelabrum]